MSAELEGVEELGKKFVALAKQINDPKLRRKLTRKAAQPLVDAAQSLAPKSEKPHFLYNTPKVSGKLKAPKGQGRIVAEYEPGNVAGSITVLPLRRAIQTIIGPKKGKGKAGGKYGPSTKRFDAYYAQWIFGNAKAFQRKVMFAALQKTGSVVIARLAELTKQALTDIGNKNGIDVR